MLFNNDVKAAKVAKPSSKPKAVEVALPGMLQLARLDALIKSFAGLKAKVESKVKDSMTDYFVRVGMELSKQPENFKGIEGLANGSCQLKIRSTASYLTDEERALLDAHKISTVKVTSQVETFIINPAYGTNMEILSKVSALLEAAAEAGEIPSDLFQKQDAVESYVVDKDAINQVFALKGGKKPGDRERLIRALLPVVSSLAVKTTIEEDDLEKNISEFGGLVREAKAVATAVAAV
jgi:hypothetical protein